MNTTRVTQRTGLSSFLRALFRIALGTALLFLAFFLRVGRVLCRFRFFLRVNRGQQIVFGFTQLESNKLAATFVGVIGEHSLFVRVLDFTFIVHFTNRGN